MPDQQAPAVLRAIRRRADSVTGPGAVLPLLRRHWLFTIIFTAGTVLRLITGLAYRPVLIFYDSPSYIGNAVRLTPTGFRPIGYPLFLAPLLQLDNLAVIPIIQHILALAAAVLLYCTLVRVGLWPWLAAVGTSAFLLDGFQLNIEQWVMADTLFETLLVIAFCSLLWNHRPGWGAALICGTALALAVSVRFVGIFLIVPALAYCLVACTGWKRRLQRAVAICAAFALPLAGYATWFTVSNDRFGLSGSSGVLLYARAASFVDCSSIDLPDYEKPLCPVEPLGHRASTNSYAWGRQSPVVDYTPPAGMDKDKVLNDFAKRVIRQQPIDFARTVAGDFLHGFQWGRHNRSVDIKRDFWVFRDVYPSWPDGPDPNRTTALYGGGPPSVQRGLATFLHYYQVVAYTNGPFLALALVIALLAACGLGRARGSGVRTVALLWAVGGATVTLFAYAASEFTWRYQMPLTIFYPVAGAVGLFALLGGRRRVPVATSPGGGRAVSETSPDVPVCCAGCRPQTPTRPSPPRQIEHRSSTGPAVY